MHYREYCKTDCDGYKFFMPEKLQWPVYPHFDCFYRSYDNIAAHISDKIANRRSPMLWCKSPEGKLEKLFVVFW
jgi:hypothetical protein